MSDEKKYTEREMVMRERAAFRAGGIRWAGDRNAYVSDIAAEAVRRFPLALITRPRVVTESDGWEWRITDGTVECRATWHAPSFWIEAATTRPTPERIRIWAGLLANPTEQVEDISNV